jgi:hypothetical protein
MVIAVDLIEKSSDSPAKYPLELVSFCFTANFDLSALSTDGPVVSQNCSEGCSGCTHASYSSPQISPPLIKTQEISQKVRLSSQEINVTYLFIVILSLYDAMIEKAMPPSSQIKSPDSASLTFQPSMKPFSKLQPPNKV